MSDTFEKANRLWFHEGRTAAALAAYEEAVRETPNDPVLAFQLARVLWSLDRFDRARSMLEQAARHRKSLSASSQGLIDMWATMMQHPPERAFLELPPALLDRDQLEADPSPVWDWRTVADAAAARRMFGLASYALSRWDGAPIDVEEAKDIDHIETNRAIEENMLAQMYADREPPQAPVEVHGPPAERTHAEESGEVLPSRQTARPPISPAAPDEMPYPDLPTIPLVLIVRAEPIDGPAGVPTTLLASLGNPTDKAQIVNRRMLLNNLNAPGEIWLDVEGPEGYRNTRGFRVRAGEASNEFFISLAPSQTVEQSWNLDDYESMHVPGEYNVTLTYHNEAHQAPDGRPMAVGKAVGFIRVQRY